MTDDIQISFYSQVIIFVESAYKKTFDVKMLHESNKQRRVSIIVDTEQAEASTALVQISFDALCCVENAVSNQTARIVSKSLSMCQLKESRDY